LNVGDIVTVITRPDAFTSAEWQSARMAIEKEGFKILLAPDVPFDNITSAILTGTASDAFFGSLPENISPSTDNKPFFFYTSRLGELLSRPPSVLASSDTAMRTLLLLVAIGFVACLYYIVVPLVRLSRKTSRASVMRPTVYFCAIGMGFMLIEISQMQRLMVFLGHPVYGLAVVLFTLLLFSGIGSMTVSADSASERAFAVRAIGLVAMLALAGVVTTVATESARESSTSIRIVLSILLLAPPAFFMGMMFPLGLSTWRRETDLLPFFWSANGVTSVFASVLGMALSMELGIRETYVIGAFMYGIALLMLVLQGRMSGVGARASMPGGA
jgi:hypothetical protein